MSDKPAVSAQTLIRMASHYLARHSASTARLRALLDRKIRNRCKDHDLPVPDDAEIGAMIEAAVERLTRAGLLDDAAYARGRTRTLAAKGWPAWRIRIELQRQDIEPDGEESIEGLDVSEDAQARRFAERKRLGPFRPGERAPYRDKDVRSLVRAGFSVSVAISVVDGIEGEGGTVA